MVSARTIFRILFESIGELLIISSALFIQVKYPKYTSLFIILIIISLIFGVLLKIYADEIYLTTRDRNWIKRIFHWEL